MGMRRLAHATARRLRWPVVDGPGGSQKVLEGSSSVWESFRLLAETGPGLAKLGLSSTTLHNSGWLRGATNRAVPQINPTGVNLYGTFSQTSVQLAKRSPLDGLVGDSKSSKSSKSAKRTSKMAVPNIKTQQRPIVFECSECRAMCVKRILKDPDDRGVVIVRCMDCGSVNLISDKLGLFKEPGSMQKFLSDRGVDVRYGPERSYELTPENLAEMEQLAQSESNG